MELDLRMQGGVMAAREPKVRRAVLFVSKTEVRRAVNTNIKGLCGCRQAVLCRAVL
jgi:hypothetical protein